MVQAAVVTEAQMKKIAQYVKQANDQTAALGKSSQKAANDAHAAYSSIADGAKRVEGAHAGVNRELLVLAHELSQGNYSKFGGSMLVLAERTNALEFAMTGAGAATLALGAAVVGGLALIAKGAIDQDKFNKSLIETNNYAGMTADSLAAMAKEVATATGGTLGNARGALETLTASGRFGPSAIDQAAKAVVQYERVTGQSAEEIAKDFARMSDGVAKWAEEHNRSMHFVSAPQYAYIKQLEEQGQKEQAEIETLRLFTEQFGKVNDKLSDGAKLWRDLKQAASEFSDSVQGIGRSTTIGDQIDALDKQLARMRNQNGDPFVLNTHGDFPGTAANIAAVEEQRRTLQRQQMQNEGLAAAMARQAAIDEAGIAAKDSIDAILKKAQATSALAEAMRKYHEEVAAATRAGINYTPAQIKAGEAEVRREFEHPAQRYIGRPNTPQQDFRTSEIANEEATMNAPRAEALKKLEEENELMSHIHELESAQAVFRRSELEDQEKANEAYRQARLELERINHEKAMNADWANGANKAIQDYVANVKNAAAQGEKFVTDAANGMSDAITKWAMTGKLSVHSMVDTIIEDLIRMETRKGVAALFSAFSGGSAGSGATGSLVDLFSGSFGGGFYANGLDYVPYDGFPAILHEGERVTSRQDAAVERSGRSNPTIDMSGMHFSFGAGVNAPEVAQAVKTGMAQVKGEIFRAFATGRA